MLKCPNCGIKLDIQELGMTERQRRIRDTIEELERDLKRPAKTREIAAAVGYADSTIKPDLHHLEHLQAICRPNGKKSGWALRRSHLRLVRAA